MMIPSSGEAASHLATFSPDSLRRIEIVIARADHEPRHRAQALEIFPDHHGLGAPIDDRAELEQIARKHHHVEIGRDLEHPIELRQRIMQICYRKEAHRSPVLKVRNRRKWL